MKLEIAHTWNGAAARTSELVTMELDWEQEAGARSLRVAVDAPYHGDPPPPGPPGPTDELWSYEVVELFVAGAAGEEGRVRYTEIELSPHGHHLVLRLEGVRNAVARCLPLVYRAAIEGDRWRGEAVVDGGLLPPPPHRGNAYAIHGVGDGRRYLAMAPVPGEEPDFHRIEAFPPLEVTRG